MDNEIKKPWSVKVCCSIPPEENCFELRADTYEAVKGFLEGINAARGFDNYYVIITRD